MRMWSSDHFDHLTTCLTTHFLTNLSFVDISIELKYSNIKRFAIIIETKNKHKNNCIIRKQLQYGQPLAAGGRTQYISQLRARLGKLYGIILFPFIIHSGNVKVGLPRGEPTFVDVYDCGTPKSSGNKTMFHFLGLISIVLLQPIILRISRQAVALRFVRVCG